MKKIPCLFERDFTDRRHPRLLTTVTPGCEWVVNGEGVATRKYDGTACLVLKGILYKRYDCKINRKTGERQTPPDGWHPCCEPDQVTGHWPGWVPVADGGADKWHRAAWDCTMDEPGCATLDDGTYELCGPHFQGNPEGFYRDIFVLHGRDVLACPRDFNGIREFLRGLDIEGIVFHHPDGRMCKIRKGDYGMERSPK